MAGGEPAPSAQISSAKDGQDSTKGAPKRSGKGKKKKEGQSAEPPDAAPDSSTAAAATQAKDKPAPAPRASRAIYVPLHTTASTESPRSKDNPRHDKTSAKQPAHDRRSPRQGARSEDVTADAVGQQPGKKNKPDQREKKREKARKQARQEAAQEAKGRQGGYAAPGGELTGSHGEGSSADCPVCWGGCTHRDGRCPCLEHLPKDLVAKVWELIGESQRHYALTLAHRYWERNGLWPPKVPSLMRVRGERFCYSCDSQDHSAADCPDLHGMDDYTERCLCAAYRFGSFNGKTPGDIYSAWEAGQEPPERTPCLVCQRDHCFEACREKGHRRNDDFQLVMSAFKRGRQQAQEAWNAIQAGTKQESGSREQKGGGRDGRSGRSGRTVSVEDSYAPAPDGSVNPPGGGVAQSSGPDREIPAPVISEQQPPKEDPPSPASTSVQGSLSTAEDPAEALSLRDNGGQSKPYWQEGLASRATTQGALISMPPADGPLPPEEPAAVAAAAAGQAGDPQPKPQTASQQLPQPMYSGELEGKLRSAVAPKHSQGLPPMPKQATSAEGPQAEQMQRSLAPHTMLVTPLAPAARRLSASGQPSRPGSTPQQGDSGQPGQLSQPGSAAHLSGPVQPDGSEQPSSSEQPTRPGSATEMLQLPPPLSTQRLPSLHSMQLNDQTPSMQPTSFSMGQHLQHGPEAPAQHDTQTADWYGGQADSRPSLSAQQLGGTPFLAQHQDAFQQGPSQGEQAEESTHSQHIRFAAEMAQQQQQQQQHPVSYHDAPDASYASHSVALGIPAAHMHNTGMTENPAYSVLPSLAMHTSWTPPAAYATYHMPQPLLMHEQHELFRQQEQHSVGQPMPVPLSHQSSMPAPTWAAQQPPASSAFRQQEQQHVGQPMPVPLNHQSSMPAPVQAAQLPAGSLARLHPGSSAEGRPEQHEPASTALKRVRAPPGFSQAPQDETRPLQDVLAQLQLPEQRAPKSWPVQDQPMQQPLSQPQDEPMPWLPNAPAKHVPHVPAPDSSFPAPERIRPIRPQPQKGSDSGRQASLPSSQAREPQEQVPPLQQPDFAEALTAQWETHSNGSSVAPSPARPIRQVHPERAIRPPRRPAPMSLAVNGASALQPQQQQQQGDDSHKDIMALLLHGVHHVAQRREASSPRRSDCPASPGLSEAPRRSLSSSPEPEEAPEPEAEARTEAEPEPEADAEAEVGTKGVWGKPLSTAVRSAPKPAAQPESPPRPKAPAARPTPGPAPALAQAEATAKPHSVPATTEPPAGRPAKATGWTKVGKHSKDKGAVPDQDKEQRLQASPSSADRADDQNLKKAIKESLKMQAAGKRKQSGKDPVSSAQSESGSAAGPGLQNDPGEYNCFLNVIVQCLWHCTAFRDAFLNLPRKVVKGDEVLSELSTLFKGFGKLAPGNIGKRTLDPTALRLALANLDPKRFAAGEMSDAAEVLNVVTERLDLTEEGRAMAQAVLGCHIREQMHCLRCGKDTRQKSYCQYLFTASASGLREQASVMRHGDDERDQTPVAGSAVIREMEKRTSIKSCNTDEGGCGRRGPMQQFLEGQQPRAFALQLVWESLQEAGQDIRDTLELIQEGIDLGKIYSGVGAGKRQYQPAIMVCYYGRHYHAFVHMEGQWRGFDDAASYVVGSWADLVHKCELGKIQPSVLFFRPA